MKLLLSIRPEFVEKILSGEKCYEFRRVLFQDKSVDSAFIYATLPVGKIVGEFKIDRVISGSMDRVWRETCGHAGVTRAAFRDYFAGKTVAHALVISNVRKFPQPLALSSIIPSGLAPQSFCYVRRSKGRKH